MAPATNGGHAIETSAIEGFSKAVAPDWAIEIPQVAVGPNSSIVGKFLGDVNGVGSSLGLLSPARANVADTPQSTEPDSKPLVQGLQEREDLGVDDDDCIPGRSKEVTMSRGVPRQATSSADSEVSAPSDGTTAKGARKQRRRFYDASWRCNDCGRDSTPVRRMGPAGPRSLCNACGLRRSKKKKLAGSVSKAVSAKPTRAPSARPSSGSGRMKGKERKDIDIGPQDVLQRRRSVSSSSRPIAPPEETGSAPPDREVQGDFDSRTLAVFTEPCANLQATMWGGDAAGTSVAVTSGEPVGSGCGQSMEIGTSLDNSAKVHATEEAMGSVCDLSANELKRTRLSAPCQEAAELLNAPPRGAEFAHSTFLAPIFGGESDSSMHVEDRPGLDAEANYGKEVEEWPDNTYVRSGKRNAPRPFDSIPVSEHDPMNTLHCASADLAGASNVSLRCGEWDFCTTSVPGFHGQYTEACPKDSTAGRNDSMGVAECGGVSEAIDPSLAFQWPGTRDSPMFLTSPCTSSLNDGDAIEPVSPLDAFVCEPVSKDFWCEPDLFPEAAPLYSYPL